jgi:hypothetical protein
MDALYRNPAFQHSHSYNACMEVGEIIKPEANRDSVAQSPTTKGCSTPPYLATECSRKKEGNVWGKTPTSRELESERRRNSH